MESFIIFSVMTFLLENVPKKKKKRVGNNNKERNKSVGTYKNVKLVYVRIQINWLKSNFVLINNPRQRFLFYHILLPQLP